VEVHLDQLLLTERRVPPGTADLVVWPENAILDDIRREGVYQDDVGWLAREKDAWFLVGALGGREDQPGYTTNGAWLIDTEGAIRGDYQKRILFPWSEYIPGDRFLGRWLPGVQRFHRWITRMGWGHQPSGTSGDRAAVLELPGSAGAVRFAPLICVENAYPPLPASAGRLGADFFLNITSEGLVGGPVQEQLLRIAMLRAVENRMAYVRVGNSGISGVLDGAGRIVTLLRGDNGNTINTPGVLLTRVPLSDAPPTLYARSRDLFVKGVVLATLLLLAAGHPRAARWLRRAPALAASAILFCATGCVSPPALDGPPDRVGDNLRDGRLLLERGNAGDAVAALAAACATEAGCRESVPFLFEAFSRGKSDDVAALTFGEIARRHPSLAPEALAARGYFLERTLELPAARDAYLASLAARPTTQSYERLGRLLVRMGRSDDAVAAYRAGLELEPSDPELRYLLGRALFLSGKREEAEAVLGALVNEHPDHAAALTVLAWIRLDRGDDSGAESILGRALRLPSVPAETRYLAAKLNMRRRDWSGVERTIDALRAAP
jgi:predicted amidohydrolase/thioredoxin-like negative regulator of GroEL